ncbi:SDR family NAD(P)-dependent oxidoreductase [Agaribacter flavus]|uniref:SDR family NAD(P)-dependent oxidoreductase n=1 Tax=Agaribacter flavus TaxID=1902781 RepID=A0ABV7FLP2_9ALTE
MSQKRVLVVGASGGIGRAVVDNLSKDPSYTAINAVSRQKKLHHTDTRVTHIALDSNEEAIASFIQQIKGMGERFHAVYICTGVLHTGGDGKLKPEKRLEDMHEVQFLEYFRINTVLPSLWLKHLVNVMHKDYAVIALITARVGSIEDNHLGGWYGYRSSKAALNMVIKSAAVEYARRSPNTRLLSYHPGTVDTGLSKPFQSRVKPEKLFTPAFTANQLVALTQALELEDSPYFLDWAGKPIPW